MIKIVNLQNTLNPITAAERVKINENWDELRRAFSQIQLQINFLAGGTEVNEIIERIENAVRMAEAGSQEAIGRVNEALSDLNVALNNLEALTTETNAAKDNAISATNDARNAIQEISDFMNEFRSLGAYNSTTQYKRNNMASLNGNTYIALSDNMGVPTTNTSVWALFARRGFDGDRGPQGEAGASLNVRGSLPNESALPSTGVPGDAYTINGDLYVWSSETNGWVNVGQIKGEKGDQGEKGDSGYYTLANFQYSVPATSEGQTTIQIPLESFNDQDHSILLFINSVALRNDQYSISGRTITLNEAVVDYQNTTFYLNITQGVLIQPLDTINGSSIANGSISNAKLNNALVNQINGYENRITTLENQTNTSTANVAGLNREVAYLKLRQQASERVEGGTVFADDFNGSRFGFTLDTNASDGIKVSNGKLTLVDEVPINYQVSDKTVESSNNFKIPDGTRTICELSNGWQLTVLAATSLVNSKGNGLYINKGDEFVYLNGTNSLSPHSAIDSYGNTAYIIQSQLGSSFKLYTIDPTVDNNGDLSIGKTIASGYSDISGVSIAVNKNNGKIHVAWVSKGPDSGVTRNIYYSSSVDGGDTWTAEEKVTNLSNAAITAMMPNIILTGDNVLLTYYQSQDNNHRIFKSIKTGSSAFTAPVSIYNASAYVQGLTSSVVSDDGTVHLTWYGFDSVNKTVAYVRYFKSTDQGANFSADQKITIGKSSGISIDSTGALFITFNNGSSMYYIKSVNNGDSWSEPTLIGTGTTHMSVDKTRFAYTTPIILFPRSAQTYFSGSWTGIGEGPGSSGRLVYNISSTDYVALFVKKVGTFNVVAYLNDVLMQSELVNNEYEFVGSMDAESNAILRLELNRSSTTGGDSEYLSRILGGRS